MDELLQQLVNHHLKDVWSFIKDGDEMTDELYEALFNHYCATGEIPYEVASASKGDPMEWVEKKFQSEFY